MSNTEPDLNAMLQRYLQNSMTVGELEVFRQIVADSDREEELAELIEQAVRGVNDEIDVYDDISPENVFQQIVGKANSIRMQAPQRRPVRFLSKWTAVAAAVLLIMATGTYLWLNNSPDHTIADNNGLQEDVPSGSNGAILTLADGSQVVLDSLNDGLVAAQNGVQVLLKDGRIAYDAAGTVTSEMIYNTLSTPKGRQFRVTLPDGTKVWLNAASSLRYPTAFIGNERIVFVTGEAYFEVAQNAAIPFRVNINNMADVDVLGTSFNVSAYDNESTINTTLITGSVRMINAQKTLTPVMLKPGQQAQLAVNGSQQHESTIVGNTINVVNDADIEKVIAWKNGVFNFNGAGLHDVMRQLERWYDIEVAFENDVPNKVFYGEMTKDIPLKGLLVALQKTEVKFRLEGRKLTVTR